jgi:hypothetical protein
MKMDDEKVYIDHLSVECVPGGVHLSVRAIVPFGTWPLEPVSEHARRNALDAIRAAFPQLIPETFLLSPNARVAQREDNERLEQETAGG